MSDLQRDVAPPHGARQAFRSRLAMKQELALALFPTLMILAVLSLLEMFTRQRVLFASLASSAFLIYLDPRHGTNAIRTLFSSHLLAAVIGLGADHVFGLGYLAAGTAMVATIVTMILLDVVHPPAVATSMSFAFREAFDRNLSLFVLALGMITALAMLQCSLVWLLAKLDQREITARTSPQV